MDNMKMKHVKELTADKEACTVLTTNIIFQLLRCVVPVVCRKTNVEVNIGHENTTVVVWICGGV